MSLIGDKPFKLVPFDQLLQLMQLQKCHVTPWMLWHDLILSWHLISWVEAAYISNPQPTQLFYPLVPGSVSGERVGTLIQQARQISVRNLMTLNCKKKKKSN